MDKEELDAIGKGADELLNEIGLSPYDLIDAGFDPEVVVDAALDSDGFKGPNGLSLSDLTILPEISPALLKGKGVSANELRAAGVSKDDLEYAGFSDAEVKASKAFAPKGDSSTSFVIIAGVAVVCIVAVLAAVVLKKRSSNEAAGQPAMAFENPMYADGASVGAGGQQAESGYMDVPVGGGGGNPAAYMDISPNTGSGGGGNSAAYMDIAPNAGGGGGGGGSSGYMDVSANGAADFASSDEEV